MTDEPQGGDEVEGDELVDTTDGPRDPLSTDDVLAELTGMMPAVPEDRPVTEDADPSAAPGISPVDQLGLDVAVDGTDPLAEYAVEEA